MAQQLKNITLGAPGFYGLNTELSPVELPPQFCTTANNCVIDSYGRLGARKGFNTQTASATALSSNPVKRIFEWNSSGSSILFAVGNNKIFRVDTTTNPNDTLTEMTLPVGYSITADDWDFVDFNGEAYFFQAGHEPLLCNSTLNSTDELDTLDNQSSDSVPAAPEANMVTASLGRLWAAGDPAAPQTIYWSDTLIGDSWEITGGSAAGSIDVTRAWPNGYDEITAIALHNGRLVIFGKHSIIIYVGSDDPATMEIEDTISGTGCIARDSVQFTGEDVVFLSDTGLRSLSRTLSQSSLPLGEMTANVRTQLIRDISAESEGINSVFSPEEGFYLLILEGQDYIYCVDFKAQIEGGRRITVWPGSPVNCACRTDDGTLYVGGLEGVGTYAGYRDGTESYRYQYASPALTFETPANLKMLKKIKPIIIGSSGKVATISWRYGYGSDYASQVIEIAGSGGLAYYGSGEYNIAEYSGTISVSTTGINATGSGTEVSLGVAADIDGSPFSLQQINVLALIGRLL